MAAGEKRAAAEAADGAVDDVDFFRVEKRRERIAPAPLALGALALTIVLAVADGGVADEDERREFRIRGLGQRAAGATGGSRSRWVDDGGRGRGGDGFALHGEQRGERISAQALQAGDDERGVDLGAGGIGVGVVLREKWFHGVDAAALVVVGDEGSEVDERDTGGLGDFGGPRAPLAVGALDAALAPFVSDGEREENRCGAFGLHVGDHLAQIRAEGADDLMFFGEEIVDFLRLVAEAADRTAGARGVVDRAGVVVAELNQHGVAGLHALEEFVPQPLGDEGAAAAAATGAIRDIDFFEIEIRRKRHAPAGGGGAAVGRGGVAGDPERGQLGIEERFGGRLGRLGRRRKRGVLRGPKHREQAKRESCDDAQAFFLGAW